MPMGYTGNVFSKYCFGQYTIEIVKVNMLEQVKLNCPFRQTRHTFLDVKVF